MRTSPSIPLFYLPGRTMPPARTPVDEEEPEEETPAEEPAEPEVPCHPRDPGDACPTGGTCPAGGARRQPGRRRHAPLKGRENRPPPRRVTIPRAGARWERPWGAETSALPRQHRPYGGRYAERT